MSAVEAQQPVHHGANGLAAAKPDIVDPTASAGPASRLIIHRRQDTSRAMRSVQHAIKPFKPHIAKPRKLVGAGSPKLSPPDKVKKRCRVVERQVEGIWLYDLASLDTTEGQTNRVDGDSARRIFYFAGGGWQMTASANHWSMLAELGHSLPGTVLTVVSYPLAPKSPASISMPQLRKWYTSIMTDPINAKDHIIFAGDSAGGNVALSLVLWALQEQSGLESARKPDAVLAICPSTDLRHLDPNIDATVDKDPMFTHEFIKSTASAWADGQTTEPTLQEAATGNYQPWSMSDPRVSPILADISLLAKYNVKVHGINGTHDVLAPEAIAFRDRCAELGVEGEWIEWDGQMHCFPLTFSYGLREAKEAVEWMINILKQT